MYKQCHNKLTQLIKFTLDFDTTNIHFTGTLSIVISNVINLQKANTSVTSISVQQLNMQLNMLTINSLTSKYNHC